MAKLIITLLSLVLASYTHAILQVRQTETCDVHDLSGAWDFLVHGESHNKKYSLYFNEDARKMAVPSSYNDVTTSSEIRDRLGSVWYEQEFYVPHHGCEERIWLRFESVSYTASVYVNNHFVTYNDLAHLPFDVEITKYVKKFGHNTLLVQVNNVLNSTSIPQGEVRKLALDDGEYKFFQDYNFEIYKASGIDRQVYLYTTPHIFIEDIYVETVKIAEKKAFIDYLVVLNKDVEEHSLVFVRFFDKNRNEVAAVKHEKSKSKFGGRVEIHSPNLWWPRLMHKNPAYLYYIEVEIRDARGKLIDIYREPFGIRKIEWNSEKVSINGKPIYMSGVVKYEDAHIRDNGFDIVTTVKDLELLIWLGVNTIRTAHFPHSNEILNLADELGVMVIIETQADVLGPYCDGLRENHKQALERMYSRDKNRPSVIAWAIANLPSKDKDIEKYFRDVSKYMKKLDHTRPITATVSFTAKEDKISQFLDFISYSRFLGWHELAGNLNAIGNILLHEVTSLRKKFGKPIVFGAYGTTTVSGWHNVPAEILTEEYQASLISKHFTIFDKLRCHGWFIGEFLCSFTDFKGDYDLDTSVIIRRGLFTRSRRPKYAANVLRERYYKLAHLIYGHKLPSDLRPYLLTECGKH